MENATVLLKTTDLILKFIDSPILKEILSTKDYEKETKMLAETIKFIGDLLSDAQGMKLQEKGGVINAYNRLRNAFLDAEDFLDQVETRKRMLESDDSDLNEICRFLSCSTPMEVHSAIKEIRRNLESICPDLDSFGLNISMESTGMRTRVAGSFVNATSIIGRDSDKRKIIDLLLGASTDQGQIPVISILGIGGMGKTTVARLVYGDESRLESCGFDLKMWVSDSQKFSLKLLLQKILKSISPDDTSLHNLGLDQLQNRVSREICGKKYLLVLDDVENESRRCWTQLEDLLKQGAKGSRILVTTRSTRVADVMGSDSATNYELKCLSEKDSWLLFEEMAFNFKGSEDEELVEIGKCIVQKCGRVPLAIKTIARLLEGQDKSKWEWVRDNAVDECSDITPILRVSYDVLDAKLKECFQYCALFQKDWPISKEMLVNIWMSNVSVTTNRGQHAEDVFEEVIKTLCSRGFLEEMEKWNDDGDTYLRMHDLMRDLAKQVAGAEMFVVDSDVVVDSGKLTLDENIRHLNLKSTIQTVERISTFEPKGRRLRTLLHHDIFTWRNPWEKLLSVDKLMSDFQVLRMLDLQKSRFHSLPDSVGRLIHLRYLNLSYNEFNALPGSIAELWNLQSLLLKECYNLKELPVGIRKLINLRHLNLEGCSALTHMPCGMGALKSLRTLNMFIVGHLESGHTAKLEDLEPLSELQGDLAVKLPEEKEATGGGAFLLSNKRLTTLKIEWSDSRHSLASEVLGNHEQMMAKLQPHSDLEKFTLDGYEGLRFPPWADDLASLLPNLVAITIDNSRRCQHLPSFSKLQCLKQLTVCNLLSLEYMEENVPSAVFFPSLEYLWLMGLPEVKGWCRELAARVNQQSSLLPSFPHLSDIHIYGCPHLKMTSLPVSPISVYSLKGDEDDIFTVRAEEALSSRWSRFLLEENDSVASSSSSSVSFSGKFHTNDSDLYISTPWEQYLHGNPMSLLIKDSNVFEIPSRSMEEALRRMSKCLTILEMKYIPRLKSIPRVLQHLVALKELSIVSCNDFTCEDEWTGVDMICPPWKGFESLRSLTLYDLPILVRLPKEVQSVTSLQVLEIYRCDNLKELSTDIQDLINLRYLKLEFCADLTETSIFTGLSLSQFQWLRCLCLAHMQRLEYIQENNSAMLSFPSLEHILLLNLPNLRDWCRGQATSQSLLLSCPRLSHVGIHGCGNFNGKSMLLSSVTVFVYGMRLWIPLGLISSSSSGSLSCELYSEEVFLLKAAILEQYHRGNPLSVVINGADVAATLMKLDLAGVSSRLTCLRFKGCRSMKTLPKVLKHLTALQKLSIERCGELTCEEDEQSEDETLWEGFNSLTHLEFSELPKMARLPEWIQFITALQELLICGCNKLLLPDWVHTNFHYVTLPGQQGIRLVRKRYLNSHG